MLLTVALIVALVATSLAVISASAETNSEPSLRAVGISLDGQVNLIFKYSSLGDADSFKVDIFGGHDFVVKASDIPLEGSDRVITVNLLPSQMMRKVTVTPFFGNTPGAAKSYSVLEYAEDVIAREEFSAYHDTVRALLNWGSFVEMHFEKTYDGLASNTLFANYTNPAYSVSEIPFTPVGAASLTGSFKGGDVFLSFGISNTAFNINIDYTGSKPDNVRLTLYGDNVELGEYPMTRLYGGEYSHAFRIGNIGVYDYDTVYKLVITDGTDSITLQKSVLEYLNWNIGASSGTAENEKNICRSLYQLYQLTAGATDGSCSHISSGQMSENDIYLLSATNNTSYVKCAHCFALLSPSPIPNSTDKYLPGDILSHAAAIVGENDGLGVSGKTDRINVGSAEYLVIKGKSSKTSSLSLKLSTEGYNDYGSFSFRFDGAGTDTVFVVRLTDLFGTQYKKTDGNYVIDTFYLTGAENADIEYIAFVHGRLEVEKLVGAGKTVKFIYSTSGASQSVLSSLTCTDGCNITEKKTADVNSYIYSYSCSKCKAFSETKSVPKSIGVYWSFNELNKMSNETNSESGKISDNVVGNVYRISGTGAEASDAQELFFRNKWDSSPIVPANGFPSTVDVGQAKYFVIKIKKNSPGFTANLTFSTTAVNRYTDATQKTETGIGTNYNSQVPLPADTEWRTIVFNAEEIASKYEMKDGKYVLDNMIIGLIGIKLGDQLDIEYFAVANTWDEIDAIVDEKSVYYLTGSSGYAAVIDVKTKTVSCDGIHVLYNSNEHWYEECEEHHVPTTERAPHNYDYNGLYYTCVGCGFIPRCNGEHTYTAIDDKTHSISACEYCGFAGESGSVESHTYITNEKGEYICSLCKNIPECKGEHKFTLTNGAHSMSACNICGAGAIKAEEHNCFEDENHVYKCSICKLEPSCHGIHEYEMTAKGHTQKACAECGFGGGEFEKHVTFDCNDTACYVCGYKLSNGHSNLNCDSKCDRCGAEIADDEPYIITPKMLFDMTSAVVGSIEIINENGTDIFRINSTASGNNLGAYWINNPEDLRRQNTEGIPLNVGDAKYIVIKYRSVNNNFRMHISTSAVSSTSETDKDGTSSLVLSNSSGNWTYYVMDASKALLEWDKTNCVYKPDENGDYIIDTFFVELTSGSNNRYLDFEFIAFANDPTEIDSLISKDTSSVNYVTSTYPQGGDKVNGTTSKASEDVSGGKIQHTAPSVSSATDGAGNKIYTAACTNCGFTLHTWTVKNYVDYFLAPNVLVPGPHQSTTTFMLEDGESYYRMTGKNMVPQHIWLREKYYRSGNSAGNPTGGGGSTLSGNLNIGNATYMIVKLRTNDTAETVKFRISTTGYNYNPSSASETNIGSVSSLIQIKASKADEWTTYAVDLTTLGKFFAKDTSGNYIIDTFCLMQNDLTSEQYIDIAYIAFVEKSEVAAFKADMDATATEDVAFEWESETESPVTITPGKYQNASGLNAAGASWSQGLFASTFKKVDESGAVNVTAAEMLALLSRKDGVKAGEVYRVSGALNLASDTTYYGNFAAIIADGGVFINNASNTSLRDIIIKGNVTIINSSDISLHQVEIRGGAVGLSIDSISSRVSVSGCAISATNTAVDSAAANVSLYRCRLVANTGVRSTGSDMTVQDCIIKSENVGIESSGNYFIARSNTITVSNVSGGIGIDMIKGSYNSMAALNVINDVQESVKVTDGINCVVVLNRAISVRGFNNKYFYVVNNRLGGELELKNNDRLIADYNTFSDDGRVHPTILDGNTNFNGDNLHDVNARLEYGANEELLPHNDPEQYVGMERRETITDLASPATGSFSSYVTDSATWDKLVIVPPGAYYTSSTINISKQHNGMDFYSYGACVEATYPKGIVLNVSGVDTAYINGLTVCHTRPTCGQVHVLEVNETDKTLLVVVSAGFYDGFHYLDSTVEGDVNYNPDFLSMYHLDESGRIINSEDGVVNAGEIYGGHGSILKDGVKDNGDGTYTIYLTSVANTIPGDILVTRLGARGQTSIMTTDSSNVFYKDLAVYATTNSVVCRAVRSRNVCYERYHAPRVASYQISEETYNEYVALEEKYGVDLGVHYDEAKGMYRGPDPVWSGTAGMETADCYEGTKLTSCIIEETTDDGSNQRGSSSRIAGMVKNSDGTYTVYYKGNLASVQASSYSKSAGAGATLDLMACATLEKGNTIVAYTSDGRVLINDAIVLTDPVAGSADNPELHLAHTGDGVCTVCGKTIYQKTEKWKEKNTTYNPETGELKFQTNRSTNQSLGNLTFATKIYSVTIDAKYVNEDIIDDYDFCLNTYDATRRVALDNVSRNASGLVFDNVLMQQIKSRGILAKATNPTIKYCTFRNLTMQAIVLGSEQEWSESTIARNAVIEHCLFDNCATSTVYDKANGWGYDSQPNFCPIDIRGVGLTSEDEISKIEPQPNMIASNFVIRHNKFINTPNEHLICATAATHITITENVFEEREGDGKVLYVNACMNIDMSGNTYTDKIGKVLAGDDISDAFSIYNCRNVNIEGHEFIRVVARP